LVEQNPKYYTSTEGHAFPVWENLPKKIEPMKEPKFTLIDALLILAAGALVTVAMIVLSWVFAIVGYLL